MTQASDTHPAAAAAQVRALRRMTTAQRSRIAVQMCADARATTLAGIRARHPEYDDATARWALFRILVGDAWFVRAWPHAPLVEP